MYIGRQKPGFGIQDFRNKEWECGIRIEPTPTPTPLPDSESSVNISTEEG